MFKRYLLLLVLVQICYLLVFGSCYLHGVFRVDYLSWVVCRVYL